MLVYFSENKPVSLLSGFVLHIPAHTKSLDQNRSSHLINLKKGWEEIDKKVLHGKLYDKSFKYLRENHKKAAV